MPAASSPRIYDLEVDGTKHRVIPRDFQLDPVRDLPVHVDFLRLGEGATIRVRIPIHVMNADQAPGVKRGGTVNIVTHTIEVRCPADAIPEAIEVDVTGLEINYSRHLSDVTLPPNVRPLVHGRRDAGHHRAAVGLRRRNEGGRRSGARRPRLPRPRRRRRAGAAAPGADAGCGRRRHAAAAPATRSRPPPRARRA